MDNLLIIAILAAIIGIAAGYIYKSRKKGQKCIGCPMGCRCSAEEMHGCSCTKNS